MKKHFLKRWFTMILLKKYNLTGSLTAKLGLKGRVRINKPNKDNENENIKKIEEFYERDDVSRATAGRKECKTKNQNKQQKRFLLDSMLNLFKKYVSDGGKCSYTTFTRHRPFYIVNPAISDRNTCARIKHSNLFLKAEKLNNLHIIDTSNLTELVTQICCNIESKQCMYNTCQDCTSKSVALDQRSISINDDSVSWFEWGLKNHDYVKKLKDGEKKAMTTRKVIKDVKTGTTKELIKKFNKELKAFKTHFFNIGHQHKALQSCITNNR